MSITSPHNAQDSDIYDPLPPQEEFWRPPARFGSIPVEAEPLGWDSRRRFEKHYPRVNLPTQIVERVHLGKTEPHDANRLVWGDNLHVMRQIPSNSIDLIYIDPPFFSGKQYNVMWGDSNELRSFNDLWEGGMTGYLIWLNARIFEMKRLLKSTGSIYVHCDWHASHYIKVEMDKIFGYENFLNEVVWYYRRWNIAGRMFARNHDTLLLYVKKKNDHQFNQMYIPKSEKSSAQGEAWKSVIGADGIRRSIKTGKPTKGVPMPDAWDLSMINPVAKERIGYPTQKPESLLERIIRASSNEGDIVADFVTGGGTTLAVAQRLGRRWIGCDQSRVAVAVTAERLKQQAATRALEEDPPPDFAIEHWGIYEAERMAQMDATGFREFVLQCYGATRFKRQDDPKAVHGWHNQLPIWVGAPALESQATHDDVRTFANAIRRTVQYKDANLRDGTMLAWGFTPEARTLADRLRQQESINVDFVRLNQIGIGTTEFREHIVGRSTDRADYSSFLTFVQPPVVEVAYRIHGGRSITFDAGDTAVVNPGAEIINVQWDFHYNRRRFSATPGYSFQRDKKKKPQLQVTHKFDRSGRFSVACRVQDSRGGEGTWTGRVDVQ